MIDKKLAKELHALILKDRERLEREVQRIDKEEIGAGLFQEAETDSVDQRPADDGSELFEREKNLTVRLTLETTQHEIDDSLGKFDEGNYGLCEICGKPIAERRLRDMPMASHYIEDQSKMERRAQVG
jgi:RNA polymerase-binding transcription factor DksA